MSEAEDQTPPNGQAAGPASTRDDEVSLLDLFLVLARNKTLIVRTVLAFTLLGVTYALLASEEYTSEVEVIREVEGGGGGLPSSLPAGALSGLGINLGSASSGLTASAFPAILESREVRLAVARDTFRFPEVNRPMTFVEYANQPPSVLEQVLKYTVYLPFTLKAALSDAVLGSPLQADTSNSGEGDRLSLEESAAIAVLKGRVASSVDQETGLMTISLTAEGPELASSMAHSFLDHFTQRVREIRTEKVREQLRFVENRFQEVTGELETAEERLARFLERNQNPTTATLQFQRDRLQRQVSFKEQLYSELQSQLTQTRIDLQRQRPVVTVVEEPAPPRQRSAPKRTFIVLLSLGIGTVLGTVLAFVKALFRETEKTGEEKEKLNEIRKHLIPARWRRESSSTSR